MTQIDPAIQAQLDADAAAAEATESNAMKSAREAAERNAGRAARADQLEVEVTALRTLGVEVCDRPLVKQALGSYQGENTADAIKAWAVTMGILEPPAAPSVDDQAAALAAERQGLALGAHDPLSPEQVAEAQEAALSPQERGLTDYWDALKSGVPREKAAGQFFGSMIHAATQNDERALWKPSDQVREAIGQ